MFILIGTRKGTLEHPKPVTVVWDGTDEGSLLIGRARHGSKEFFDGVLEGLQMKTKQPVDWAGIAKLPEGFKAT